MTLWNNFSDGQSLGLDVLSNNTDKILDYSKVNGSVHEQEIRNTIRCSFIIRFIRLMRNVTAGNRGVPR